MKKQHAPHKGKNRTGSPARLIALFLVLLLLLGVSAPGLAYTLKPTPRLTRYDTGRTVWEGTGRELLPDGGEAPIPPVEEPTTPPTQPPTEAPPAPEPAPEISEPPVMEIPTSEPTTQPVVTNTPEGNGVPIQPVPPIMPVEPEQPDFSMPPPPLPGEPPISVLPPIGENVEPPILEFPPPVLEMGEYQLPVGKPGEQIAFAIPVDLTYMEQHYYSNTDMLWPEILQYDPQYGPEHYDQTIAALLDYVRISVDSLQPEGFPLDLSAMQVHGDIVADQVNRGYAVFTGLRIPEGTAWGTYPLQVTVRWRENTADAQEQIFSALMLFEVQIADPVAVTPNPEEILYTAEPFAGVPWEGGIIVYTYEELRQAVANPAYSVIYLGYNETNQGVIEQGNATGIAVSRSVVIDGHDPSSGRRVKLVDRNSDGQFDGLYAGAGSITITMRNMDITGRNWYGIVSASSRSNVLIRFENIVFTGRQLVHNRGANSTVELTGCHITITNVGSGGEEEVAETGGVTFYGTNTITRTGPLTNSLFWMSGTSSRYVMTVAEGAVVNLSTTDYMVYTESSAQTELHVHGTLNLTTTGNRGSATFADHFFGVVNVYDNGSLNINHQHTATPTLQVRSLVVNGRLTVTRNGSLPAALRIEAGGSMQLNNPRLFLLNNPGGATVRARSGTATFHWVAQVINRFSGGGLATVWNNADMSQFSVEGSFTNTRTTVGTVRNLYSGSRGDAIDAAVLASGNLDLANDGRLVIGRSLLTLDTPYGGQATVSGRAGAGSTQEIREYALVDGARGALLQSKAGVQAEGNGRFTAALDTPIARSDSRIYAISDDGVLVSHTYRDPIPTGLSFLEIPNTMTFDTVSLSTKDQWVPRSYPEWAIRIFDPRDTGEGFALYARIEGPLTSDGGDVLPGSLVFVQGDTRTPFTETDMLIARGSTSDGEHYYTIQWGRDEGLLVYLPAYAGTPYDPYTATIVWTLTEGP